MNPAAIGARIRARRLELGLTLVAVCRVAKRMDPAHLSRIERGEVEPRLGCLTKLANILRMPVSRLLDAEVKRTNRAAHRAARAVPRLKFSAALRNTRLACGFTISELSRMSGVSRSLLSQYEAGKKFPKIENIVRLEVALGADIGAFVRPASSRDAAEKKALVAGLAGSVSAALLLARQMRVQSEVLAQVGVRYIEHRRRVVKNEKPGAPGNPRRKP